MVTVEELARSFRYVVTLSRETSPVSWSCVTKICHSFTNRIFVVLFVLVVDVTEQVTERLLKLPSRADWTQPLESQYRIMWYDDDAPHSAWKPEIMYKVENVTYQSNKKKTIKRRNNRHRYQRLSLPA